MQHNVAKAERRQQFCNLELQDEWGLLLITHIKRLRQKLGLTQEELAKRAGLSVSYLADIENGRKKPAIKALVRIAEALGVSTRDL